jgi:hypothetical protein
MAHRNIPADANMRIVTMGTVDPPEVPLRVRILCR